MMKKLIVNADDFGLTHEINQGIIKAYNEGILTSTSLVASGEAFEEAVTLIHQHPNLDVGVHLTLIEEKSVLPPVEIPSLVNNAGYFRKSAKHFTSDYLFNRIMLDDVRRELRAQIQKIHREHILLSHVDSHQHIHIIPKILSITMELTHEFQIKAIRAPFEQIRWSNFLHINKWPRLIQQLGLNFFARHVRHRIKGRSPDYFFGFFYGGCLNTSRLARMISRLPNGVSEIMCHPGLHNGRSMEKYAHWGYSWQDECHALRHQTILDLIASQRVMLTSFRSL